MLRTSYTGLLPPPNRRLAATFAFPVLLAGCSLSVAGMGAGDSPLTTGSIAPPVQVRQPLPQSLAFSDASKIGQAAAAALWQAGEGTNHDWENASTGSSGTIERDAKLAPGSDACRPFHTVVTSIGGVHRYAGSICRKAAGQAVVAIDPPESVEG